MWSEETDNKKGRWGAKPLTKELAQDRLDADSGIVRERLRVAGTAALLNIIAGADVTDVHEALINLRNRWITQGIEDKRELEDSIVYPVAPVATKRNHKKMTGYEDA